MKPRLSILVWLITVLSGFGLFEFYTQYLWRYWFLFPHEDFDQYLNPILPVVNLLPLEVYSTTGMPALGITSGFDVRESFLTDSDGLLYEVYYDCCKSHVLEKCFASLKKFSETVLDDVFYVVRDPNCVETRYDQVFATPNLGSSPILAEWKKETDILSGPFSVGNPIVVVRILLVQQDFSSILWGDPLIKDYLLNFLSRVPFECILDISRVYGAHAEKVFPPSVLPLNELAVWEGVGHHLSFGTYTMPPLRHIAVVLDEATSSSISVDGWGTVSKISNPEISAKTIISVFRKWLGLGPCKDQFCASVGISKSEKIFLAVKARSLFLATAVSNLNKLSKILKGLPKLKFEDHQLLEQIKSDFEHFQKNSPIYLSQKIAATSFEILNGKSVSAAAHFSIEFQFALYAPLFLPMCLPVLTTAWRYFRKT